MGYKELHTIWLREIKKALSDKWALLIGIGWPVFLIFVIGIGIDSFVDIKSLNIDYTNFLGPGVIAIISMGGAASIGNSIIEDKKGFIKELLVAPISRTSIFIGKILGEMTVNFAMTLVILILFLILIKALSIFAVIWAFLFMVLIAFGFYGLGIILSFLFKKAKYYQIIVGVFTTVIIFFSGAFFPIKNLPVWMKSIAIVNPLTYGVDGLRHVLTGYSEFNLIFNIVFLLIFGIVMVLLGSYGFKRTIEA